MINAATAQLGEYCGLPTRGVGMTTDSKVEDMQAGYEAALTLLMAALSGVNYIMYAGSLESTLAISFEKYVIDDEVLGMVTRALKGIDVDEERLALDVIDRVGPGGHFLCEEHTRRLLRIEHFIPWLSDRSRREVWEKEGGKDIRERARKRVIEILEGYEPEPLDEDVERSLQGIIEEVKRREGFQFPLKA